MKSSERYHHQVYGRGIQRLGRVVDNATSYCEQEGLVTTVLCTNISNSTCIKKCASGEAGVI